MRKVFGDLFEDLDPFGRFWLWLGLIALAAAAAMSYSFGVDVSIKHGIFLAILSVVAAFGPMASEMLWGRGRKGPAIATALICVPLLGIEFYSHAGFTAGLRGSNLDVAMVQNTKWQGAQDGVTESKTDLARWEKRLADLEAANVWAPTVTAEALRAQLASANLAIDLEAKRGGCKSLCLARTKERDEIASKVAIAEEHGELTKKIEATRRVIETARKEASATDHKVSAVGKQNEALRTWVAMVVNGDTKATEFQSAAAQESANLAMAIAGTGLPAFALFLAGVFRRKPDDDQPSAPAPITDINPPRETPIPSRLHTKEIVRTDASVWNDMRLALEGYRRAPAH
jgi:hypothetical protein